MKSQHSIIPAKTDNIDGKLTAILYLLQTSLEEFKDEVDKTYELHKIGEVTDLSKKIGESISKNPLENLHEISNSIENNCIKLIDAAAINFFSVNKDIVHSVYKISQKQLHYSIVLKEDSMDNRNKIFNFFDMYPISTISYKFPIYFQFATTGTVASISAVQKINI